MFRVTSILALDSSRQKSVALNLFLCVIYVLVTLLATCPWISSPWLTLFHGAPCKLSMPLSCLCLKNILFSVALVLHCFARAFSSWWAGVTLHCGAQASPCSFFSCCRAQALGPGTSVVAAPGLSSCGARTSLLRVMWNLPKPGIEPMSPTLAGRFFSTAPPGKSLVQFMCQNLCENCDPIKLKLTPRFLSTHSVLLAPLLQHFPPQLKFYMPNSPTGL